MTSALSPRDIQTRIRSGGSVADVASEAGLPEEKVEPFAAPVLAEREHVAGTALQCPVRRRGETGSVRAMRAVVEEKLAERGLGSDDVEWDAWRNEDRRWSVVGRWGADEDRQEALFTFDLRARFSVAANDQARWLIGEYTASATPVAPVLPDSPDAEPTIDLNDELALVRAVQGAVPLVEGLGAESPAAKAPAAPDESLDDAEGAGVVDIDEGDAEVDSEVDDYSPAELEQVDGVYDIVPGNTSEMDVLYEMLSSFSEDSVNIYAGLSNPVTQEPPLASGEQEREVDPQQDPQVAQLDWVDEQDEADVQNEADDRDDADEQDAAAEPVAAAVPAEPVLQDEPEPQVADNPEDSPAAPASPGAPAEPSEPTEALPAEAAEELVLEDLAPGDLPRPIGDPEPETKPDVPAAPQEPAPDQHPAIADPAQIAAAAAEVEAEPAPGVPAQPAQPEQDALVETPDKPEPAPRPKARPRKKRASLPSWDEIMFGGPTPPKNEG